MLRQSCITCQQHRGLARARPCAHGDILIWRPVMGCRARLLVPRAKDVADLVVLHRVNILSLQGRALNVASCWWTVKGRQVLPFDGRP